MTLTPLDWDAATYGTLPLPHRAWGRGVLDRLALSGGETVLELGCGTGRDAAVLLAEHHDCRLIGLDASPRMLATAQETLAPYADRVELHEVDLRQPWVLERPVDAAMSVATLHWLPDHATVFACVAAELRPGGRFVAEAGGAGQLRSVEAARQRVEGVDAPADATNFAGPAETRQALEDSGFEAVDVRLRPDPLHLDEETLRPYLATVILGAVLRELPASDRAAYVDAVVRAMAEPVIDYVRLELAARRA